MGAPLAINLVAVNVVADGCGVEVTPAFLRGIKTLETLELRHRLEEATSDGERSTNNC